MSTATSLLLCVLSEEDSAARRKLGELAPAEWEALLEAALSHELDALLHHVLESFAPPLAIPEHVHQLLQERAAVHGLRTALLERELHQVLDAFARAAIDAIVLKGACLAWNVYPEPALRSMGDVDLLVRTADLERARDVLLDLGYAPGDYVATHHLPAMRKPGATTIEVHWTIERASSPFRIDVAALWARAVPARVAGRPVLSLSPADLLIHLSLHVAYHHRFCVDSRQGIDLKHLYDVLALMRRPAAAIEWGELCRTATEWGAAPYVYAVLDLVEQLFGVPIPPQAASGLEHDARDERVAEVVAAGVLSGSTPDTYGYSRWTEPMGLAQRLARARGTLFPGLRKVAQIYDLELAPSSPRVWLMAGLRPFLLGGRFLWIEGNVRLGTDAGRALAARTDAQRVVGRWLERSKE
jgi:hypothetical protein